MTDQKKETITDHFFQENGMTLEESWEKVREWNFEGKQEEVKRGCRIILEFFPDHEAKILLEKIENKKESEKKTPAHKGIAEKIGGKFAESIGSFLKSRKSKVGSWKLEENNKKKVESENKKEQSEFGIRNSEEKDQASKITSSDSDSEKKSTQNSKFKIQNSPQEFTPPKDPVLEDERLFGAISYAWIFCIIPLVMKRKSIFVQFHAKQGLIMAIVLTIFDLTIGGLLNVIFGGFNLLLKLLYLGILFYAAYQAYQGKYWQIPVIFGISQKIKL